MQIENIEIHTGRVDFDYTSIRQLEAKCEATTALHRAPTMDDVNAKLRQLAASVGANAIINVEYKSGASMTSWKSMKATGLAVRRQTDDMPCPVCAETIKRAAKKCRFCGSDLSQAPVAAGAEIDATASPRIPKQPWAASPPGPRKPKPHHAPPPQEPLRSTDNPWWIMWVILGSIALFTFLFAS